jgi:hypothetical protein
MLESHSIRRVSNAYRRRLVRPKIIVLDLYAVSHLRVRLRYHVQVCFALNFFCFSAMDPSSLGCSANGDNVFGPQVEPCLRSFDFTLTFENIFFSLVPSVIFLAITPIRLYLLRNVQKRIVAGSAFQISKLVSLPCLFPPFIRETFV